jgi:hypothetical protein
MSKPNGNKDQNKGGGQLVTLPQKCKAESCSHKDKRYGFCDEHFMWYKEGLITKEGIKVIDFDKKMQALQRRNRVA